jgi:hypothetical protein
MAYEGGALGREREGRQDATCKPSQFLVQAPLICPLDLPGRPPRAVEEGRKAQACTQLAAMHTLPCARASMLLRPKHLGPQPEPQTAEGRRRLVAQRQQTADRKNKEQRTPWTCACVGVGGAACGSRPCACATPGQWQWQWHSDSPEQPSGQRRAQGDRGAGNAGGRGPGAGSEAPRGEWE